MRVFSFDEGVTDESLPGLPSFFSVIDAILAGRVADLDLESPVSKSDPCVRVLNGLVECNNVVARVLNPVSGDTITYLREGRSCNYIGIL